MLEKLIERSNTVRTNFSAADLTGFLKPVRSIVRLLTECSMSESSGPAVGYKVVGKVTAEDYQAWLPDLKFGHRFHDKIEKMAIVGDKRWQKWLTALADPFYADEAEFFRPEETAAAWDWLRADD